MSVFLSNACILGVVARCISNAVVTSLATFMFLHLVGCPVIL